MSCARGCCPDQASHYKAVVIGGLPSPQQMAARAEDKDMHAYKRLRQQGLQPKGIAGSAELERGAHIPQEIEQGHLIKNARLRREVADMHTQLGGAVLTPGLPPDAA